VKTVLRNVIVCLALVGAAAQADDLASGTNRFAVQPVVPLKARAFPLNEVRLLNGPFKHAMELDEQYLLSLDPDRLLHNFRVNAGLPSTAQPLGGWEDPTCELRGHFVGHYLSAAAQMYAATGDERFKQKGDAVVAGLAECQAKLKGGYLSAYPESFIDRVENRAQVWAPYYTLHKILAGLLDMYVYCDNSQALETAKKFGDWVVARNSKLTDEQMQGMLGNEHGGMNEALANLYALTGEDKYLKISLRFNHHAVLDPAAAREDKLTGLHANTQIPKFIGHARQFELTGDNSLKTAALFFWTNVAKERSYVIGGHSDGEMFTPKDKLSTAFGPNTTETCNTYNMLKLTRHLFCLEPQADYADFYERALYNHILASQNPETGMMCYYVPLRTGSKRNYNAPTTDFWCCTGTGVENHGKYGDSIYFHDGSNTLYLNLFIASELNWKEKGVRVRQETQFPDEQCTRLIFTCDKPMELTLRVRHPGWARPLGFRINGFDQPDASRPGSYATVTRTWKSGDTVELALPFELGIEGFKDNVNRFAYLYGPLVLGAAVDTRRPFPVVVPDKGAIEDSFGPVPGRSNTFRGRPEVFRIAGEKTGGVTLEPFYKIYDRSYAVYWDRFTPQQWQAKEQAYVAEQQRAKELDARTVDSVSPGEEQNERDHNMKGEQTSTGGFGERKYRHANPGGWFSWDLKILTGEPQQLVITYWGSDTGRKFDVVVNDHVIATQQLNASHPDTFYDETYALSGDETRGRQSITVKLEGKDTLVGGVFGVRVLKFGTR
jgi:DUF1680 family protein